MGKPRRTYTGPLFETDTMCVKSSSLYYSTALVHFAVRMCSEDRFYYVFRYKSYNKTRANTGPFIDRRGSRRGYANLAYAKCYAEKLLARYDKNMPLVKATPVRTPKKFSRRQVKSYIAAGKKIVNKFDDLRFSIREFNENFYLRIQRKAEQAEWELESRCVFKDLLTAVYDLSGRVDRMDEECGDLQRAVNNLQRKLE